MSNTRSANRKDITAIELKNLRDKFQQIPLKVIDEMQLKNWS